MEITVSSRSRLEFSKFPSQAGKISISIPQAPVVQKVDSAIHRINHYPMDNTKEFVNTYPLDSDLSDG